MHTCLVWEWFPLIGGLRTWQIISIKDMYTPAGMFALWKEVSVFFILVSNVSHIFECWQWNKCMKSSSSLPQHEHRESLSFLDIFGFWTHRFSQPYIIFDLQLLLWPFYLRFARPINVQLTKTHCRLFHSLWVQIWSSKGLVWTVFIDPARVWCEPHLQFAHPCQWWQGSYWSISMSQCPRLVLVGE